MYDYCVAVFTSASRCLQYSCALHLFAVVSLSVYCLSIMSACIPGCPSVCLSLCQFVCLSRMSSWKLNLTHSLWNIAFSFCSEAGKRHHVCQQSMPVPIPLPTPSGCKGIAQVSIRRLLFQPSSIQRFGHQYVFHHPRSPNWS